MFCISRIFPIVVVLISFCGCSVSNKGALQDTVASLPDGSKIYIRQEKKFGPNGTETQGKDLKGPLAIWKRPGMAGKTLVTLAPTPGSPIDSEHVSQYDKTEMHTSKDGNRVWLVQHNLVTHSFDYKKGVAIIGQYGQPEWATVAK